MRILETFCVSPERVDVEEAEVDHEEETTWRGGWSLRGGWGFTFGATADSRGRVRKVLNGWGQDACSSVLLGPCRSARGQPHPREGPDGGLSTAGLLLKRLRGVTSGVGEVSGAPLPPPPPRFLPSVAICSARAPVLLTGVCWDKAFDIFVIVSLLSSALLHFSPLPLLSVQVMSQAG